MAKILGQPLDGLERNLRGTWSVLEAACRSRRRVLFASSSEVYGHAPSPLREDQPLELGPAHRARWSYGVAKLAAEHVALACARERGLPVTVVRVFNTIGPRQRADLGMVVPRLVRQAVAGEPLTVYGDGSQQRSFCNVRDLVAGWLALADADSSGAIFNLGSDLPVTIRELALLILALAGRADEPAGTALRFVPYREALPEGYEDIRCRVPDLSRVKAATGWQATTPLEQTLRDVLASQPAPQLPEPAPRPG
jgi:UDP-glucose 4-epimerase